MANPTHALSLDQCSTAVYGQECGLLLISLYSISIYYIYSGSGMQFVIVIKSYIPDFDYFQKLSIRSTIAYMYVKPIVI